MNNKTFPKFFLALAVSLIIFLPTISRAQTSFFQNAFKNIQESLEEFIGLKTENSQDFHSRVVAFEKILDLTLSEAEDLRLRLLSLENLTKKEKEIRDEMVSYFDEVLAFYRSQKQDLKKLANNENVSLDDLKNLALKFKQWREKNYLPQINRIYNFLLINLEKEAISMAFNRFNKINQNLSQLKEKGVKNLKPAFELLNQADKLIQEGKKLNQESENLFWLSLTPFLESNSSTTEITSSMSEIASSTTSTTSSLNSFEESSSSTLSIKDLTKASLSKIKDAYQIFIEISNLVRKLLS